MKRKFSIILMIVALLVTITPVMLHENAHGSETEMGFGAYRGLRSPIGPNPNHRYKKYDWNIGFISLYYGWRWESDVFDAWRLGFELPIGFYEWDNHGLEFTIGINLVGTVDLLKHLYVESGLGVAYMTGAAGSYGDTIATDHVPGTIIFGFGTKFPVDDGEIRIGIRYVQNSAIFYGPPFGDESEPGAGSLGGYVLIVF